MLVVVQEDEQQAALGSGLAWSNRELPSGSAISPTGRGGNGGLELCCDAGWFVVQTAAVGAATRVSAITRCECEVSGCAPPLRRLKVGGVERRAQCFGKSHGVIDAPEVEVKQPGLLGEPVVV